MQHFYVDIRAQLASPTRLIGTTCTLRVLTVDFHVHQFLAPRLLERAQLASGRTFSSFNVIDDPVVQFRHLYASPSRFCAQGPVQRSAAGAWELRRAESVECYRHLPLGQALCCTYITAACPEVILVP